MRIFGIEAEPQLPNGQVMVSFDDLNYQMLLKPQSTPTDSLRVEAIDPDGRTYSKDFSADSSPRFSLYKEDANGVPYDQPLIGFTFLPPANVSIGTWTVRLTIDGKPSSRKYVIQLYPMIATLSTDQHPDPFGPPTNAVTSRGGTLYLFGRSERPKSSVLISLYRITDYQNPDLSFKLKPTLAASVMTDAKGNYQAVIKIGNDFPPGQYKIAHGDNQPKLYMFEAFLRVD
jgi:hypothetical protein